MGCGCGGRSYSRTAGVRAGHAPASYASASPRYTNVPSTQPKVVQAAALAQRRNIASASVSAQPPVRRQV